MIRGRVDARRQARVSLEIRGNDGRIRSIEAVIDTGFSGYLTLPPAVIRRLGLEVDSQTNVILADNVPGRLNVSKGQILWHDRLRTIPFLAARGVPLLGMRLLAGSQLNIQVRPGGEVVIEEM